MVETMKTKPCMNFFRETRYRYIKGIEEECLEKMDLPYELTEVINITY